MAEVSYLDLEVPFSSSRLSSRDTRSCTSVPSTSASVAVETESEDVGSGDRPWFPSESSSEIPDAEVHRQADFEEVTILPSRRLLAKISEANSELERTPTFSTPRSFWSQEEDSEGPRSTNDFETCETETVSSSSSSSSSSSRNGGDSDDSGTGDQKSLDRPNETRPGEHSAEGQNPAAYSETSENSHLQSSSRSRTPVYSEESDGVSRSESKPSGCDDHRTIVENGIEGGNSEYEIPNSRKSSASTATTTNDGQEDIQMNHCSGSSFCSPQYEIPTSVKLPQKVGHSRTPSKSSLLTDSDIPEIWTSGTVPSEKSISSSHTQTAAASTSSHGTGYEIPNSKAFHCLENPSTSPRSRTSSWNSRSDLYEVPIFKPTHSRNTSLSSEISAQARKFCPRNPVGSRPRASTSDSRNDLYEVPISKATHSRNPSRCSEISSQGYETPLSKSRESSPPPGHPVSVFTRGHRRTTSGAIEVPDDLQLMPGYDDSATHLDGTMSASGTLARGHKKTNSKTVTFLTNSGIWHSKERVGDAEQNPMERTDEGRKQENGVNTNFRDDLTEHNGERRNPAAKANGVLNCNEIPIVPPRGTSPKSCDDDLKLQENGNFKNVVVEVDLVEDEQKGTPHRKLRMSLSAFLQAQKPKLPRRRALSDEETGSAWWLSLYTWTRAHRFAVIATVSAISVITVAIVLTAVFVVRHSRQ